MDDVKYELLIDFLNTLEIDDYAEIIIPKGIVEVANKAWSYRQNIKVKNYLEGFHLSIENNNITREKLMNHQKVIGNKSKQEIFLEVLESALKSSTEKIAQLLGYYAGKIIINERIMSYDDQLIIDALSNLNDWDLSNLTRVYNYFDVYKNNNTGATATAIYFNFDMDDLDGLMDENEITDYEIFYNVDLRMFKSALKKLISVQLLDEGALYGFADAISFLMNDLGNEICRLSEKIELKI